MLFGKESDGRGFCGMKILLAAVNAKFIHSNLAVRTLCAYAKKCAQGRAGD